MSVEFTLSGNSLDLAQWNELFVQWSQEDGREIYEEDGFEGDDEPALMASGPGSIRGFMITLSGSEVQVRLNVLSSIKDWELCFSFLKKAIAAGGGLLEHEDGTIYPLNKLTDESAMADAMKDFTFAVQAVSANLEASDSAKVTMPCGFFSLQIGAEDLSGSVDEVMLNLAKLYKRYAEAYIPTMVMQKDDGTEFIVWSMVPTILPKVGGVSVVNLESTDQESYLITWKDFEAVLGDYLEDVGAERFYVPDRSEIDKAVIQNLFDTAEALPEGSARAGGSDLLSESEGEADARGLIFAPGLIMLMVAGADGNIDKKEITKAAEHMTDYIEKGRNDKIKAIYLTFMENIDQVIEEIIELGPPMMSLAMVMGALKRNDDQRFARTFKKDLIKMATAIAAASGGILGIFGSKISKEEQETIDMLDQILDWEDD